MRAVLPSTLLLALLACLPCAAQITVPPEIAPHTPIVATCDVPAAGEGGSVQVLWECDSPYLAVDGGKSLHIWAAPGQHPLKASVFSVDWESRTFSVKQHRAEFRVTGEPTPNPPGPLPPSPEDPPGPLAELLPEGVDRLKLAAFYRDFATVVANADKLTSTGQFRDAQRLAVEALKSSAGLPAAPQVNQPISDRLEAAIGLENRTLDATLRAKLVATLQQIGEDF